MRFSILIVLCFALFGCGDNKAKADTVTSAPAAAVPESAPTAAPEPEKPQRHPALDAKTREEAFKLANPGDGGSNEGMVMFAGWAASNMKWSDVGVTTDETSSAKIKKDSDEERGKRICASGRIIEIETAKTPIGKFYEGGLITNSRDIFRFVTVGSSGDLVEGSQARLCGVVTGTNSYSNSAGGTTHGVQLVGMFDLPENRKR